MITGFYYLHTNGRLIFRHDLPGIAADMRESDFAVMLWSFDTEDRGNAWTILVEALACGADLAQIQELASWWHCNDADAQVYADRVRVLLSKNSDQWCATRKDFVDLQESPAGFGNTALEAMAELCKGLGYNKTVKIWRTSFAELLKQYVW